MNTDAFATLASIGDFLSKTVLPVVPRDMASDVKAIVKLLRDVSHELDWLPAVLLAEIDELQALEHIARPLLLDAGDATPASAGSRGGACREPSSGPLSSVSELLELHRELCERTAGSVHRLQARIRALSPDDAHIVVLRALLDRHYEALGRHAETRLRWQSVFTQKQSDSPINHEEPRNGSA